MQTQTQTATIGFAGVGGCGDSDKRSLKLGLPCLVTADANTAHMRGKIIAHKEFEFRVIKLDPQKPKAVYKINQDWDRVKAGF